MQFKLFLMLLLLIATLVSTCLADKMQENASESLKDDDGDSVDSKALVSDLQNKKRVIFAVGLVSSKMTLFISGPGGKSDTASGCTVQVKESSEGVFRITNPPEKMPAGVASADVIFVCIDSPGSRLVRMSSSSVDTVKLPDGGSEPTKITKPNDINYCFDSGSIHLSSSNALHYYVVGSDGAVEKFHFGAESIASSSYCNREGNPSKLCINDDKVTIKEGCSGASIPGLVSGYVSTSTAYLFAADNTVYVFGASAFSSGQPTDLKKVDAADAWAGNTPAPVQPHPSNDDSKGMSPLAKYSIIVGSIAVFLFCFTIVAVGLIWWFFLKDLNKKKKPGAGKDKGGKDLGGRTGSSSKGGHHSHHQRKDSKGSSSKHGGGGGGKSNKSSSAHSPSHSKSGKHGSKKPSSKGVVASRSTNKRSHRSSSKKKASTISGAASKQQQAVPQPPPNAMMFIPKSSSAVKAAQSKGAAPLPPPPPPPPPPPKGLPPKSTNPAKSTKF